MQLLLIRHAIAEDRDVWAGTGNSDDERPLTDEGRGKMALNAKGIRSAVETIDLLVTSPLVRARQTAQIVADAFKLTRLETTKTLAPDAALADFVEWLEKHGDMRVVAAVGHEPHLSTLATWLLTGVEESRVELKKGAACLIDFGKEPVLAGGRLRWSIAPAQLRDLAAS